MKYWQRRKKRCTWRAFTNVTRSVSSEALSAESTPEQLPHRKEQGLLTFHFSLAYLLFPFFPCALKYSAREYSPSLMTFTSSLVEMCIHSTFGAPKCSSKKGGSSYYKLSHSDITNIFHLLHKNANSNTVKEVQLSMCCDLAASWGPRGGTSPPAPPHFPHCLSTASTCPSHVFDGQRCMNKTSGHVTTEPCLCLNPCPKDTNAKLGESTHLRKLHVGRRTWKPTWRN